MDKKLTKPRKPTKPKEFSQVIKLSNIVNVNGTILVTQLYAWYRGFELCYSPTFFDCDTNEYALVRRNHSHKTQLKKEKEYEDKLKQYKKDLEIFAEELYTQLFKPPTTPTKVGETIGYSEYIEGWTAARELKNLIPSNTKKVKNPYENLEALWWKNGFDDGKEFYKKTEDLK